MRSRRERVRVMCRRSKDEFPGLTLAATTKAREAEGAARQLTRAQSLR